MCWLQSVTNLDNRGEGARAQRLQHVKVPCHIGRANSLVRLDRNSKLHGYPRIGPCDVAIPLISVLQIRYTRTYRGTRSPPWSRPIFRNLFLSVLCLPPPPPPHSHHHASASVPRPHPPSSQPLAPPASQKARAGSGANPGSRPLEAAGHARSMHRCVSPASLARCIAWPLPPGTPRASLLSAPACFIMDGLAVKW